jgi:tetratricopeptide (TPR) repeat protein
MEDDAEAKAAEYAEKAINAYEDNPVAYQQLASVRLSQGRNDEAKELLLTGLSKWLNSDDEAMEPSYTERINLVKLLLEVDLYDEAMEVLSHVQREDEEHVELWYLYTCAYFHNPKESKEENWKNALECAETCLKWYQTLEWDDEKLKESCEDMMKQIREKGIVADKEENVEEDGEDEEWESDDNEDVEMQEIV